MFFAVIDLIENFVSEEEKVLIARTILDVQDIREESYGPDETSFLGYSYKKTLDECAIEACKNANLNSFWVRIIEVLNIKYWNDIQYWAESKLDSKY